MGLALVSTVSPQPAEAQALCPQAETQQDLNACAAEAFRAADGDLNDTYQLAISQWLGGRDTTDGQALLAAQRAWLAYRDAHCDAEALLYAGGSIRPMIHAFCLADLTRARTERIRSYAEPQ